MRALHLNHNVCIWTFTLACAAQSLPATTFSYTTINVPGAAYTVQASGINDSGDVAGYAIVVGAYQGFVEHNGVFTIVSVPGAFGTQTLAINNAGQMAGTVLTNTGGRNAFIDLNGAPGVLSVFGSGYAEATALNDAGQVVGYYSGSSAFNTFLYQSGTLSSIFYPGSYGTEASGINNAGEVVGFYFDRVGIHHAFTYLNGAFGAINVPGDITAINNLGEIAGTAGGGSAFQGFVDNNGVVSTVFVPGSYGTEVTGINDLGQVVGFYFDSTGSTHAFEATPTPEPSSLLLTALAGIACLCARHAAKR